MELYLRSDLTLDELARELIAALRPDAVERRHGLNLGGGDYYLFKRGGAELHLVVNAGEMEVPEMARYRHFLRVYRPVGAEAGGVAAEVARALAARGIESEGAALGA